MTGPDAPDVPEISPDLADRLGRLGTQAVDPATQSQHLTAMASVRIRNRSTVAQKLKVASGLLAGIMLGSTGLAFAGALPTSAQDVASDSLAKVGISVPVGTERYFGDGCVAAEDGSHARNRGQYLKQERAKGAEALAAAKASKCGMPLSSLTGDDSADAPEVESDDTATDAGGNEANKPEKCVDGVKVTGKSEGKGRSDDAKKSDKPCTTPTSAATPAPAAGSDDSADDAEVESEDTTKADDHADDRADDRGKSDVRNDDRSNSGKGSSSNGEKPDEPEGD